jgi:6-phosphogluconolactonase (cycloisomerase 2 family)
MNPRIVLLEQAVPYLARGNPAQEHAPLAGHQKSRTPCAAPLRHPNQIWPRRISNRNSGIRSGWLKVWSALAITLVATSSHAEFAYVANLNDNTVSGYTIDPTTGALAPIAGSPVPAGLAPEGVAVDPSGKFAYVANAASNNVSGYTIDPSTGALTAIASPFPAGTFPVSVAVDPSGKFAYVANTGQIGQRFGLHNQPE